MTGLFRFLLVFFLTISVCKAGTYPAPTSPSDSACGITSAACNHQASASYDAFASAWQSMTVTHCTAQLTLTDGRVVSASNTCAKGPSAEPCPNGGVLTGDVCEKSCPPGTALDSVGICKSNCPEGTHAGGIDMALCLADCIGDQTQQADGSCRCQSGNNVGTSFAYGADGSAGNCANGCSYKPGAASWCPGGVAAALGLKDAASVTCYGSATSTGDICGSNAPNRPNIPLTPRPPVPPDTSGTGADGSTPDPKNTPDNSKSPESCGASGGTYYTSGGVGKCGTATPDNAMDKVTTNKKSTTTTNPDGTTTTKTESTETTTGPDGTQVTKKSESSVTKDGAGNVIGTSGSNSTGSGSGKSDSGQVGDCTLEPDAPHCRKGTVKAKGKFESLDPKVAEAKAAFQSYFDTVKIQAKAAVGTFSGSGGGSLPCPAPIQVLGRPFTICAAKYESQLSVIGLIVMFIAAVASVFIVFKRG